MPDKSVSSALPATRCLEAVRHVAALFSGSVSGGPALFEVTFSPGEANPELVVKLGDQLPPLDQNITLQIAMGGSADGTVVQIQSKPVLTYFTGALGFDRDAVESFASTLDATLIAYANRKRPPTFPAPPRPPA